MSTQSPVTVLFVDDEPLVLRSLSRLSKGQPWEALVAESVDDALAILGSQRVDILVSDIDMPMRDGLELVRLARREHPLTLRLVLTGAATLERALEAINVGEVTRILTKPFDVDGLRETIGEMVKRVQTLRAGGDAMARSSRRAELAAWVEAQWPGTLEVARTPRGDVEIDVSRLDDELQALGPARSQLFRRDV